MPNTSRKRQEKAAAIESVLITPEEASKLFGVSTSHFMRLAEAGQIPVKPIRLGKSVRFHRGALEQFLLRASSGCLPATAGENATPQ